MFVTALTVGTGFTVIVKVIVGLLQVKLLFELNPTTLNVDVIGEVLVLVAVNDGIFPVLLFVPKPISGTGTVRIHRYEVPETGLPNTMEGTISPAQYVLFVTAFTCDIGFTVIVNCIVGPVQVKPLLVNDA